MSDQDRAEQFGGDMEDAVSYVLANIFGDRWEDDDEQRAVDVLCEAYTSAGYSAATVKAYAENSAPGYNFERVDSLTWSSIFDAGLAEPGE